LKHNPPDQLRKHPSCTLYLIHGAGQTDDGICGANVNLALIRRDENRNVVNVGGRERQVHGEGPVMRRILVVDDDPHICLALRAWLKRYGFRVSIADGGANGLAVLATATFDLMIVDIFMPNMRGFESIRVFHERAPTVPLIAISGHAFSGFDAASPDILGMAVRLGATRCLRKPFRPTTLLGVIDECLSEAEPHRRYVATLTAVANALSEPQHAMDASNGSSEKHVSRENKTLAM
jgi:CheY-like chemotaxis protein